MNVNDVLIAATSERHHRADRLQVYQAAGYASSGLFVSVSASFSIASLRLLHGVVTSQSITLLGSRFSHECTLSGALGTPIDYWSRRVGVVAVLVFRSWQDP